MSEEPAEAKAGTHAEPEAPPAPEAKPAKRKAGKPAKAAPSKKKGKSKEKEKRIPEKKPKAERPKPPHAPADGVREGLLRFVTVRTRERYPETRRWALGAMREVVRARLEERPELLEAYRKNRRSGEQEALALARELAEELAGRKVEEAEGGT